MSEAPVADPPVVDPPAGEPPPSPPAAAEPPPGSPPAAPPEPPAEPPAPFYSALPDTWRADTARAVAGKDASEEDVARIQKQMERFSTYEDFAKNRFDLQRKVSEGFAKSALPENATEEQVAEWRAANGVPEAADKYELNLGEGVTLAGEDKAVLDALLPTAHELNLSNDVMSKLGEKFFEARAQAAEARQTQDGLDSKKAESVLKEHWKSDFAMNRNIMEATLAQMPEGLRGRIINARMPGGTGLMNDPEFVSWAVDMQRQANPTVTVVPAGDENASQTISDEIKALEKRMRDDREGWYKDEAAQKRLRDLYDAQERLAAQKN